MKKLLTATALALLAVAGASAQEFEHAQTRILEGSHEFFVRPVVAELQILSKECKEWPPYNTYPGVSLESISEEMLANAKANATYKAAKDAGADIIFGATYYVTNDKKQKGLNVVVRGYPAKYVKFHNFGDEPTDAKWIGPLQDGVRNRAVLVNQKASEALKTNNK